MKLLDLNILLYATNKDSAPHAAARSWLESVLNGAEAVALPWTVLLGFLRLTTNRRVFAKPLTVAQACAVVDGWLARPNVITPEPGTEHWRILRALLGAAGTAGNLTTDAHLAALALEHDAELCSTDADFARFAGVRWVHPLHAPER